nr:MAG TPA: Glucose-regulated metallo-peptidase M90 [Caudoviricetes sp.]
MAEIKAREKDEEIESGGGGNKNAIACGLLQGAGVNTSGLTPSQAWELVSQLNLMESKRWKRTEEDKKEITEKNKALKESGENIETIKRAAEKYAANVMFTGVGNTAALKDAVDAINGIMEEYGLKKLSYERVKNLANGTMASANSSIVNIGSRILRNPNAAYRICTEDFNKNNQESITYTERLIREEKDVAKRGKLEERLKDLKKQAEYNRHNVIYKGEEVKCVITHEMGHVLAGQKFGFISAGNTVVNTKGKNELINNCFNESLKNGDIKKVSAYAAKNPDEFFAECFTMYKIGKEKLPANIEKMIKGVLGE